jgi:hypothetical protein
MAPLLQNLCLSLGDNEEACFCLKAWQVRGKGPASCRVHPCLQDAPMLSC